MSLSDMDQDFTPMDLTVLETFNREIFNKTQVSEPDLNRFKLLFEKPEFEEEIPFKFEAVYHTVRNREEIVFKPLIEPVQGEKKTGRTDKQTSTMPPIKGPDESHEEKGYRDGVEKGFKKGMDEGRAKGHEEGLISGEAKGFEKGEQTGLESGYQQGFEKGLKEGEEKGDRDIREKSAVILNTLEESLAMADQTLNLLVAKYEERFISLIQKIAKKAVMAQVQINDEIVRPLILDALKTLVKPEDVVLSISEKDYEYIEMIKEDFFEEIASLKRITVKSDPSVKRGGCRIDTSTASIVSDPELRLEAIFEAMKNTGS